MAPGTIDTVWVSLVFLSVNDAYRRQNLWTGFGVIFVLVLANLVKMIVNCDGSFHS